MRKTKKYIASLLTLTILFAFTFTNNDKVNANNINSEEGLEYTLSENEIELNEFFDESVTFMNAIENMPDSIIEEGSTAIVEWLQLNVEGDFSFSTDGENLLINSNVNPFVLNESNSNSGIQTFGIASCVGAIGAAFVTGILPIAKIAKIKNALNAVGGTTKFVTNIIKHYNFNRDKGWSRAKSYDEAFDRATEAFGSEIKAELGALFGITAIYGSCFE